MPIERPYESIYVTIEPSKSIPNLNGVIELEGYVDLHGHFVSNCNFFIEIIMKVIRCVSVDFSQGVMP